MAGRISGLGMGGGAVGYVNPDMPPEVVRALAERGLNPDGSRIATADRLQSLNDQISTDWAAMGFTPSPMPQAAPEPDIFVGANSPLAETGPDPFGAATREKLAGMGGQIDADMARTNALADAIMNADTSAPVSFGDAGRGRPVTPFAAVEDKAKPAAAVAAAPKPPIPKARPAPTTYTVKAGDNPTKIAKALGISLKQLEAKNPGILKRAKRLQIGSTVKV